MPSGVRISIAAACVTGCSLVISLDDLRSGDASIADVTNDVNVVTDSGDAGSPPACPSVEAGVVFCDDFDDSDASTFTHWSATYATAAATVSRVSSDASPPFAVRFATSPNPDGGIPQSELQRVFLTAPKSKITYSFSIRVMQYASALHIAPVTLNKGDPLSSIDYLVVSGTGSSFWEQVYLDSGASVYPNHALTESLATGDWTRVKIEWTLGDAGVTVLVSFNDAPVAAPFTLDPRSTIGALQIAAGMSSVIGSADAGAQVDVDDVVITVE